MDHFCKMFLLRHLLMHAKQKMECALKMARHYHFSRGQPERTRIVTFEGAFHGRTLGTLAATGAAKYLEGYGEPLSGFDQVPLGDIEAVKKAIGPTTAAILIEPLQGEGGAAELRMIVETPRGSNIKFEYEPSLALFTVSRALHAQMTQAADGALTDPAVVPPGEVTFCRKVSADKSERWRSSPAPSTVARASRKARSAGRPSASPAFAKHSTR